MLELSRPSHGVHRSENFLSNQLGAVARICVAFEHDQRGGAGRMCCCEQGRRRECAVDREENRFSAPEIVEHCGSKPEGPSQLFLVGWGGAMARIGAEHSPLAERGARFVVHPLSLWEDPADDARAIAWSRGFRELMAPYRAGGAYLNFLGDEGSDRVRAAFGAERHERLARVKARFDPRNVLRGNHNVEPAA